MKAENIIVNLQVNTQEIISEEISVIKALNGMQRKVLECTSKIITVFSIVADKINDLTEEMDQLAQCMGDLDSWELSTVLTTLEDIRNVVGDILDELKETDWVGIGSLIMGAFSTGFSVLPEIGSAGYKGKFEKGKKGSSNRLGGAEGISDNSSTIGITSSMFAGGGDFSSVLPDGEMLQSLGELTAKLKESAAAWLTQTGAKIADKAVDLQIMALYALDYVKAFGAMIAQIAASTAAWIANTAVKVANTAAQWAQIAATTAWNALCAVATTVTTAQ